MESNNTCKQIEISLDAFHDGELTAEERIVVEQHLKSCADCVNKLAEIDRLVHTLRTMPRAAVSSEFSSKLDSLIDQQTKVVPLRSRLWIPTAVAAAVVAMVFGARALQPSGSPVAPQPQVAVVQPESTISRTADTMPSVQQPVATAPEQNPVTAPDQPKPPSRPRIVVAEQSEPVQTHPQSVQIAALPDSATISSVSDSDLDQLAELPTVSDSFADAIGFSTDEDGLYDLKM